MAKKSVLVSSAEVDPLLVHAIVPAPEGSIDDRREALAAKALGVELLGLARDSPLSRTWRASKDVVVAEDATATERELFARTAEDIQAAAASLPGVLRVRAIAPSREAFLTDLWTTGSARDLSALKWSPRRRVDFVLRIVRALEPLHALGMVHGCLCPANVLLDDALEPVLAEAGSVPVRALADRGGEAAFYMAFAAPEVARGDTVEARSDIYSVGRILDYFVNADESNATLREIVRRCSAPDAAARRPSAAELATVLLAAREHMSDADSSPAPVLAPLPPPLRDHREALGAAVPSKKPRTAWVPPRAPGFAGIGAVAVSLAASAFLGGSSGPLRAVLGFLLVAGAALATTLARPPEAASRNLALGMQAVLAVGTAVLLLVIDPLDVTYRMAAQRHLGSDEAARNAAIVEIVRLGRDFRGLSLAGQDLAGMDLAGADLRGVDLSHANLAHASLFGAEVRGASFDGSALAGATLEQVELSLANVGAATCDRATRLPHGWSCRDGHVERSP